MSLESPLQEMKKQAAAPNAEKSQVELRTALEKKLLATRPAIDASLAEYEQALRDGTFEDVQDEAEGAGEKRQKALQKKLLTMVEHAENMKKQLDSGTKLPQTPEIDTASLNAENKAFLNQTLESWYNATDAARAIDKVEALDPTTQDYKALAGNTTTAEFGAYTLNPETQGLDFEKLKAFVPDLSAWKGKKVHEVMQHVVDTYGSTYHIPGIEYWKWLIENPGKTPPGTDIKDGNYYFLPGSVLRGKDGEWNVPCGKWLGSKWLRDADWLTSGWDSLCRVVLLEK